LIRWGAAEAGCGLSLATLGHRPAMFCGPPSIAALSAAESLTRDTSNKDVVALFAAASEGCDLRYTSPPFSLGQTCPGRASDYPYSNTKMRLFDGQHLLCV
jgi:hypothetical protein